MLMPGLAVACSVVLLLQHRARVFPVVALVASGLELLMSLGVVRLNVGGFPLSLVLGAALLVGGVGVYVKASAKPVVSAATVVTLLGLIQVLGALHLRLL